jgi:Domain of unknown function (DUF4249)
MKLKFFFSLIIVIFTGAACKEVYYPELDAKRTALVVNGLITDVPGIYTVKLSKATSFYGINANPEQRATVYIEDAEGNHYPFSETIPGTYNSDPAQLVTKYGETYTLIIQTNDNKVYKSSAQKLYPKGSIDTIYSDIKRSTLITYYFGTSAQFTNVKGAAFVANINLKNDSSPYYRFSNTLLVESLSQYVYFGADTPKWPNYCWQKYIPYDYLNLTKGHSNSDQTQQLLGFCPVDTNYFGIILTPIFKRKAQVGWIFKTLQYYVITFKQYHLNSDIYKYYEAVNTQLAANQQILDPVSVQCIGNISCVTNPDEPVLGLFEASSLNMYSYIYSREASGSLLDLKKISPVDIEKFPATNCRRDSVPPYFWTTMK